MICEWQPLQLVTGGAGLPVASEGFSESIAFAFSVRSAGPA